MKEFSGQRKPGAPTNLRIITTTNHSATFAWDKPDDIGWPHVESYRYKLIEKNEKNEEIVFDKILPVNTREYRVESLSTEKIYVFEIAAQNFLGCSKFTKCK